jgi:hypothetical protein
MNQMARETAWYLVGLVLQVMWTMKSNKEEIVIDPMVKNSQEQQTNTIETTWMQFLWEQISKNSEITPWSVMVMILSKWILSALWNYIKERIWSEVSPPPLFHEGMNVNKWLKEFEEYADKCKYNDTDKRTRELFKNIDNKCAGILKKSLDYEDDCQIQKKMYYPAFKQQMVLLFVTTRIKQREAKLNLLNRNQAEDESITRYCYELMNLANEAYPGADQKVLDAYVHEQILHGLRNPIVRSRLVNEYGKSGQLSEIIQVAKIYEEEVLVDKKVEKKEHKIKKIISESDCSIKSNSDEEQYIRKFERQSRRSNGIANYRKEAEVNNKTKEHSEWKNKTKDEISNTIPPKHSNDNKEEDKCKTESPKKTVTLLRT